MAEKHASKEDVAARLKVTTRTVDHWLKDEKKPQPGKSSEIDVWLNEKPVRVQDLDITEDDKLKSFFKIIDIQNTLLDKKFTIMQDAGTLKFRIIPETKSVDVELVSRDAFLVGSISSLEASVNVLTDLLLAHIAEGDTKKLSALKKEVDESKKKEVRAVLEKHEASGVIKIS